MSHQIVVPMVYGRIHPIVGVPCFIFSTCGIAYNLGKRDEKERKRYKDDFLLRSYPEKDKRILWIIRARAGGDKEFRPSIFHTIHLSREARQELHAERKSERERRRASNAESEGLVNTPSRSNRMFVRLVVGCILILLWFLFVQELFSWSWNKTQMVDNGGLWRR